MQLIRSLMEKAARATPASTETRYAGWWLRHTDSETWWAGAVLAHGSQGQIGDRIGAAERFYANHNAPPRFQICPACPPDLDALLAQRRYITSARMSLMTAEARSPMRGANNPAVTIKAHTAPSDDWVTILKSAHPTGWEAELRMISRVSDPSTFVTAYVDGVAVGTGRGVADDGSTGVFHLATVPLARGTGVARSVLATISQWASTAAAERLHLQVDPTNVAAIGLYEQAGFELLTDYTYRVAPWDLSVPVDSP